ncbi:unnamed protein product [Amoebophrya sp. A120]|nr:unnamed protein product [Amoebophrya sp. A120]|eukprot:GSA120T00022287001.1
MGKDKKKKDKKEKKEKKEKKDKSDDKKADAGADSAEPKEAKKDAEDAKSEAASDAGSAASKKSTKKAAPKKKLTAKKKKQTLLLLKAQQKRVQEVQDLLDQVTKDLDAAEKAADKAFQVASGGNTDDLRADVQKATKEADWKLSQTRRSKRAVEAQLKKEKEELQKLADKIRGGKTTADKPEPEKTQYDKALGDLGDDRPVWSVPRNASKKMGGLNTPVVALDPRGFRIVHNEVDHKHGTDDDFTEFPKRQALFNMSGLQEMRFQVRQMRLAKRLAAGDPDVFPREFTFKLTIVRVENMTDNEHSVFIAGTTAHNLARADPTAAHFYEDKYNYSDPIPLLKFQKVKLAKENEFYSKRVEGSYIFLKDIELRLDAWSPSLYKMNDFLGTATRKLYDLANGELSTYMTVTQPILNDMEDPDSMPAANKEIDRPAEVMRVGLCCIMQEMYYFEISFAGLHFLPRIVKQFADPSELRLRISAPCDMYGNVEYFTSDFGNADYTFEDGGTFLYEGTRTSFQSEYVEISIISGMRTKGAGIIPLAGTDLNSSVRAVVKAVDFREKSYFLGVLTGFVAVKTRSKLLPPGIEEDLTDPTIPRPMQPLQRSLILTLDPKMQYLLVEVYSADGLPVADPDSRISNPIVRCSYDGIVLETSVAKDTTRPVYNQYLHFPVRYANPAVRTDPKLQDKILPVDIIKRGNLEIEVWHHNGVTTSELLGRVEIDPHLIMQYGVVKPRAVADPSAQARQSSGGVGMDGEEPEESMEESVDSDADSDAQADSADAKRQKDLRTQQAGILTFGIHPDLIKQQKVRVYQARKETLTGGWIYTSARSSITFDAYFIPDFAPDFVVPSQPAEPSSAPAAVDARLKMVDDWNEFFDTFNLAYTYWFIDAIPPRKRRFICTTEAISSGNLVGAAGGEAQAALNQARQDVMLLPSLIRHTVLPDGFRYQAYVLHWLACIPFTVSQKQHQTHFLDRWLPVQQVLHGKKGSVQDHCALLCSILTSLGADAYVCKGTVRNPEFDRGVPKYAEERLRLARQIVYREHCWVMTREKSGTVVFWETTQAITFQLKRRWTGKAMESEHQYRKLVANQQAKNAKWKNKEDDERKADSYVFWDLLARRRDALTRLKDLKKLPIVPMAEMGSQSNMVALPYYSIEIVFNKDNVWGNLRNHDPAWIRYDLDDDHQWKPLMEIDGTEKWLLQRNDSKSLVIGPSFRVVDSEQQILKIQADVEEAIRFARLRIGLQTKVFRSAILGEVLSEFLDNMEKQCLLDPSHCTNIDGAAKCLRKGSYAWDGSLLTTNIAAEKYRKKAKKQWQKWWDKYRDMDIRVAGVPIPESTTFEGVPFHLSTMELREIRAYISSSKDARRLFMVEEETSEYVVQVNIYPLQHEIGSVWIFLGRMTRMTDAEVAVAAAAQERTIDGAKREKKERDELKSAVMRDLLGGPEKKQVFG